MDVTLQWDANSEPDLAGYVIYYQVNSPGPPFGAEKYVNKEDVHHGDLARHKLTNLSYNATYFLAVKAHNSGGRMSDYSSQVACIGTPDGALIAYDSSETTRPYFGPRDDIPNLNLPDIVAAGLALNLQPLDAVFNSPIRIFIPCPGYTDVSNLSVYSYNGAGWVLASDADGVVEPEAEGWIVPGSRKNHNSGTPARIEIQVYHLSGVQAVQAGEVAEAQGGGQ